MISLLESITIGNNGVSRSLIYSGLTGIDLVKETVKSIQNNKDLDRLDPGHVSDAILYLIKTATRGIFTPDMMQRLSSSSLKSCIVSRNLLSKNALELYDTLIPHLSKLVRHKIQSPQNLAVAFSSVLLDCSACGEDIGPRKRETIKKIAEYLSCALVDDMSPLQGHSIEPSPKAMAQPNSVSAGSNSPKLQAHPEQNEASNTDISAANDANVARKLNDKVSDIEVLSGSQPENVEIRDLEKTPENLRIIDSPSISTKLTSPSKLRISTAYQPEHVLHHSSFAHGAENTDHMRETSKSPTKSEKKKSILSMKKGNFGSLTQLLRLKKRNTKSIETSSAMDIGGKDAFDISVSSLNDTDM
ncbi:hypothetical protein BKA69DRAFT_1177204 [Paraphysoderma sedebokerense]|nr:hypothetical protein BKA69DRAFT_1177204 [Paraphysoderma sedebokerense]